jgi:hypothetical protein
MWIKQIIKAILGDEMLGWLDYYRSPELTKTWGGPFNGQVKRQAIILELLQSLWFDMVVETGAFRGTTTEFLSSHLNGPVLTVENNARFYGYVRARFRRNRNISVTNSDSRAFLSNLAQTGRLEGKRSLFYLDAHWGADLPLFEELDIVFSNCHAAVAVIDDFQVPDDKEYGYDDYGDGKSLTPGYVAPLVHRFQLAQFFPASPASEETGRQRGCVVLAKDAEMIRRIESMPCLRRIDPVLSAAQ